MVLLYCKERESNKKGVLKMISIENLCSVAALLRTHEMQEEWMYEPKYLQEAVSEMLVEIEMLCSCDSSVEYAKIVPVVQNERKAGRKVKELDGDFVYEKFCNGLRSGRSVSDMAKECCISTSTAFRWKKRMLG